MFRRGTVFYCEDRITGQQKSLLTKDEAEARKIIRAKNEAVAQPLMNLVLAKTYLAAQDPKLVTRTWSDVMDIHPADPRTKYGSYFPADLQAL